MIDENALRVSQERDTPVTCQQRRTFGYRYAYSRSADSAANQDKGQDYLVIHEGEPRLIFALCDGVSQSFYGDLAARFVGDALVQKLSRVQRMHTDALRAELESFLTSITDQATQAVQSLRLPDDVLPFVRPVLEQKRELGSESMFIAGLFDFSAGQLYLTWMGDSRLRIWGRSGELPFQPGEAFKTRDRWSTRRGLLGDLHIFSMPLSDLHYLIAYSDGLARLDKIMARHFRDASIDTVVENARLQPESDDTSFFEVWMGGGRPLERPPLAAPSNARVDAQEGRIYIHWNAVPGARCYEVQVDGTSRFVDGAQWQGELPKDSTLSARHSVRIRAWDEEPGGWTAPLTIAAEPAPLRALEAQAAAPVPVRRAPAQPTPAPRPLPPPPVPAALPPTKEAPKGRRGSQFSAYLTGMLTGAILICAVGAALIAPPASPLHTVFFPSSPTPHPTTTLPATRTPRPTQTQSPLRVTATELILTQSPSGFPKFCTAQYFYPSLQVVADPWQGKPTYKYFDSGICLYFDGWTDANAGNSYWLHVAPDLPELLQHFAGTWIRADGLSLTSDPHQLTLPQIIPSPEPSNTPEPSVTPAPSSTLTPTSTAGPLSTPEVPATAAPAG